MKQTKQYFLPGLAAMACLTGVAHAQEPSGNTGKISREVWWSVGGSNLEDLWNTEKFYQSADLQDLRSELEAPSNIGNNFGQRLRGYIVAPVTGEYRFWISGDDHAALWLGDGGSKFSTSKLIDVRQWSNLRQWGKYRAQQSAPVFLETGKRYFIEAQNKEGGGGDHLSVGWSYAEGLGLVNWARETGAVASQSSTDCGGVASRAIDGNTSGDYNSASITHTYNQAGGWWQVDLGLERQVDRIELFNRNLDGDTIAGRLANFKVSVLDVTGAVVAEKDFYTSGGSVQACEFWETGGVQGHTVKLELLGANSYGEQLISLAEVQVWGRSATTELYQPLDVVSGTALESYAGSLNDLDGDELPDDWEAQYGFDATIYQGGDYSALADPDGDYMTNIEESRLVTDPLAANSLPGHLTLEKRYNIEAFSVRAAAYAFDEIYQDADTIVFVAESSTGRQTREDVAQCLRGYIIAPEAGNYTFWLSATNAAQLLLSSNDGKYRKQIISELGPEMGTGAGTSYDWENLWDVYVSQMSEEVYLQAGQKYFMEVLHQEDHHSQSHASVAWARPGHERESIPAEFLLSYFPVTEDSDDDSLLDSWETQYGLSITDNGLTDRDREGEHGDFDADGLNNRLEYIAGTDPSNADTDGDGLSDADEINSHGTNPLTSDAPSETIANTFALDSFTSASANWSLVDGGLLSDVFRGSIAWNFSVPSSGPWVLQVDTRVRGKVYANELIFVNASIDGTLIGRYPLQYGASHKSIMRVLSPNLAAGTHSLTLEIDNLIGRRMVQIDAITLRQPSGIDADSDGISDWIESQLAQEDYVLPHATTSRTSPVCLEGKARVPAHLSINSLTVLSGADQNHWYVNLPLVSGQDETYAALFANGQQTQGSVFWTATNVLDSETLTIRKDDSLRLGAWLAGAEHPNMQTSVPDAESSTLSIDGVSYALANSMDTQLYQFSTAGTYTVLASHSSGSSGTLTVTVKGADLPDDTTVVMDLISYLTLQDNTQADRSLWFEGGKGVNLGDFESINSTSYRYRLYPDQGGRYGIVARLWENGPILDVADVTSVTITDALQNDISFAFTSQDFEGYNIITTPMVVLDLPTGGKVVVTIFRSGVTFLDGTKTKTFYTEDIVNGLTFLEFLYPAGMTGGYCHYITIYDANGTKIGTR